MRGGERKPERHDDPRTKELEALRLRSIAHSLLKQADALDREAKRLRDRELAAAAKARRAEARAYFAAAGRHAGSDAFLRGFGLGGEDT